MWSHYCLASRKSFNNLHKSRLVVFRAHRGLHIVIVSRSSSISSSSHSRRVYRLGCFFIGIVVKVDNRASTWSWIRSRVRCVRVQVTSNLMSILVLNVLSCPAIHLLLFRLSPTLPQPPPPVPSLVFAQLTNAHTNMHTHKHSVCTHSYISLVVFEALTLVCSQLLCS